MRIAWFSPLPPLRSGIATYSADLLARARRRAGDRPLCRWPRPDAAGRADLRRPRLRLEAPAQSLRSDHLPARQRAVPRLHVGLSRALPGPRRAARSAAAPRARAASAAAGSAFDDYRREFRYDHPDAPRDVVEYAVEGLGGSIYYVWSMLRVVMRDGAARRRAQPAGRRRSARRVSRARGSRRSVWATRRPALRTRRARERVRAALGVPATSVVFARLRARSPRRSGSVRSCARSRAIVREQADVHLRAGRRRVGLSRAGRGGRGAGDRASASTSPAIVAGRSRRRLPRGGRRLPVPALADGARDVGVVAALPGGVAADRDQRPRAPRRHSDRRPARLAAIAGARDRPGRDRDRPAGRRRVAAAGDAPAGDRCAAARRARARRPCVLGGEPHARRDGRRLPPAPRAGRRTPGAGRRRICRRISPRITAVWRASLAREFGVALDDVSGRQARGRVASRGSGAVRAGVWLTAVSHAYPGSVVSRVSSTGMPTVK